MSKTTVALISVFVVVLATGPCVALWLYHKYRSWQAHNNPHALQMTFNELEARDNEERKSSECSGAAQPLIQLTEHPPENTTSPTLRTDEGMRLLPDIPPSLENEPQNLGKYYCTYLLTIISRLFVIRVRKQLLCSRGHDLRENIPHTRASSNDNLLQSDFSTCYWCLAF